MSRSSFGFRSSFRLGRKLSRDNRKESSRPQNEHNEMHNKRQRSRHVNSDAEKAARSIFGDVPLTDTERRYLWAAQSGNLLALEILIGEAGTFNLSCRDYLGRTALQLAVLGEHFDCIQLLLNKVKLDVIEEGLLHAIKAENVKICDMFLSLPIYSDNRARTQLEFQHGFYEQEDSSASFAPDITPIVLAAQCNNFDIVHMLIQKGFTISTPHNYFCQCPDCNNHKNFDRVVHSKSRLNAYRGLASTAYLALSCDDPIYAAFELSRNLQKLAQREKEHKSEYRGLSDQCKDFAVELLDQCRTNEEVMAALHGGTDTTELSRIKMAIRYDQKKFIAHASCQEHLASMWYAGAPWFQHQNFGIKLVLVPLGILFIPLTAIVYVFIPYSKIGRILKSPFMKFMNYICSYAAFLVLLFLATQLTSFKKFHLFHGLEGVVNSLIMFYVLGMFWAECKQLWEEGVKGYFSQMWNYMDITMLALYTAGYSTEGVIYSKVGDYVSETNLLHSEDDDILNPQILSKVLFSVANVLSFARMAYILPASETFGQLQISYGRMLQDVGKFIFIYVTVMIAFICGLTSLYSISNNTNFSGLSATTGTLFWAAFGLGTAKAPQIKDNVLDANSQDSDALHRGLNGNANDQDAKTNDNELLRLVEMVGYILYGVYILGAVVVLINMLIAMMSNTFEEIQKSEDCEWKFARAKLWISFIEQGTTLPIPFNIVPTPKSIIKLVRIIRDHFCCTGIKHESTRDEDKQYELEYKAIMHRVVLRFIHKMKFEKKDDSLKDELLDAREELLYQLHHVAGGVSNRIELMERDMQAISTALEVSMPKNRSDSPSLLSYSRSVPSYPRDLTSAQSNVQNLRRGRSYYIERPKRKIAGDESQFQMLDESYGRGRVESLSSGLHEATLIKADDTERRLRYSAPSMGPPSHRHQSGVSEISESQTTHLSWSSDAAFMAGSPPNDMSPASHEEVFTIASEREPGQRSALSSTRSEGSPQPGGERSKTGEESHRVGRKRETSCFNPRWTQNVIEESVFEDHPMSSVPESRRFSPVQDGSVRKRRDTVSHPNIDAPFGHVSGSQSPAPPPNFVEPKYQKPKKQEALQNLILDVNSLPMSYLKDLVTTQTSTKDNEEVLPSAAKETDDLDYMNQQQRTDALQQHDCHLSFFGLPQDNETDRAISPEGFSLNPLHPLREEVDPTVSPIMGEYDPKGLNETSLVYYNESEKESASSNKFGHNPKGRNFAGNLERSSWPDRKRGQVVLKRSSVVERDHGHHVGGASDDLKALESREHILNSTAESGGNFTCEDRDNKIQSPTSRPSDLTFSYDQTLPLRQIKAEDIYPGNAHQKLTVTLLNQRDFQSIPFDPGNAATQDIEDSSRQVMSKDDASDNVSDCPMTGVSSLIFNNQISPQTNSSLKRGNAVEVPIEVNPMSLDSRLNSRFSDVSNPQNSQRVHLYRKKESSLKSAQSKHHRVMQFGREQVYPSAALEKHEEHPQALTNTKQQRHNVKFNPEGDPEEVWSTSYNVRGAEAMVIPPMAANLQPFVVAQKAGENFSSPYNPIFNEFKQSKPTGLNPTAETLEPRKKKSSLVSLVRGRRSDKSKEKQMATSHNRSLSLNRYGVSKNERVKTLQPQRSKEV